jgi:hypothetical protein
MGARRVIGGLVMNRGAAMVLRHRVPDVGVHEDDVAQGRPVVSTKLVHSATTAGAGGDGGP